MDDKLLETLEKLCAAATPGPWRDGAHVDEPRALVAVARPRASLLGLDADGMAVFDRAADAALVVAARNALPDLLAEIRRLRDKVDDLVDEALECAERADDDE